MNVVNGQLHSLVEPQEATLNKVYGCMLMQQPSTKSYFSFCE
ncbi:hypothetical protein QI522_07010 [Staphylococcus aureus]|nr:hypothetical protein [Staphylococcus aureus]MDI1975206.1 hypothetical protein [Staphylococcus aureus]MEC7040220.1 hypothetical protein [Staphylococcus aureus]